MSVIAVVNPKGGVGKSTLSTNLAGYFAARGDPVALGDLDPQHSSHAWLGIRPATLPLIQRWSAEDDAAPLTSTAILDTPAAISEAMLKDVTKRVDRVIVPLQPSIFDIFAVHDFLKLLAEIKNVRRGKVEVGIVGMRVDARTKAAEELQRFVEGLDLPVLGYLRDTQNYIQLAAHGMSLWDVAPSRVEKDLEQWGAITTWLEGKD